MLSWPRTLGSKVPMFYLHCYTLAGGGTDSFSHGACAYFFTVGFISDAYLALIRGPTSGWSAYTYFLVSVLEPSCVPEITQTAVVPWLLDNKAKSTMVATGEWHWILNTDLTLVE